MRRRDGRAFPRLEAIAECIKVTIGPDARIGVRAPCAAEITLRFQHAERLSRRLVPHVPGRPHTGNARPGNQDVKML